MWKYINSDDYLLAIRLRSWIQSFPVKNKESSEYILQLSWWVVLNEKMLQLRETLYARIDNIIHWLNFQHCLSSVILIDRMTGSLYPLNNIISSLDDSALKLSCFDAVFWVVLSLHSLEWVIVKAFKLKTSFDKNNHRTLVNVIDQRPNSINTRSITIWLLSGYKGRLIIFCLVLFTFCTFPH